MKVAAMEGHWERQKGAPFIIIGFPDEETESTVSSSRFHASALILTHELDGETPGLKDVPPEERRPLRPCFGLSSHDRYWHTMALIGVVSVWLRFKDRLYTSRPFLQWATVMGPSGFIAVVAGWIVTEVGRQLTRFTAC